MRFSARSLPICWRPTTSLCAKTRHSIRKSPFDPSQFRDYLEGRKRAYVIVGGRHQFFPKRELDTIEYSIEDTYRGLYQELRGYLGKPGRHQGRVIAPTREELTYARYGFLNYGPSGK